MVLVVFPVIWSDGDVLLTLSVFSEMWTVTGRKIKLTLECFHTNVLDVKVITYIQYFEPNSPNKKDAVSTKNENL